MAGEHAKLVQVFVSHHYPPATGDTKWDIFNRGDGPGHPAFTRPALKAMRTGKPQPRHPYVKPYDYSMPYTGPNGGGYV